MCPNDSSQYQGVPYLSSAQPCQSVPTVTNSHTADCPPHTKLSPKAPLLRGTRKQSASPHFTLFTSQHCNLHPTYHYRKDERALTRRFQSSIFCPVCNKSCTVHCTSPLLRLSHWLFSSRILADVLTSRRPDATLSCIYTVTPVTKA